MLTESSRKNRKIRKRWEHQHKHRAIMNTERKPYVPLECGSCRTSGTLLYMNARLTYDPGVRCRCTNCGKVVVILSPHKETAFFELYRYASFWTKLRLALQRWLADIV